jgi:hypothetical protein
LVFVFSKEQDSSFSEEKEAKRLLFTGGSLPGWEREPQRPLAKVFLVLFLPRIQLRNA